MAEIVRIWLAALLTLSPNPIPQPSKSLYVLQQKVAQGDHVKAKVAGIYSSGVDQGVLEDTSCSGQYSWVELDLQSSRNKNKLKKLMDAAGEARVVFDGEFYGPPKVDEKLPPSIQKAYHPGWGHLGAFKSKFVVHTILEVAPAPTPKY